MREGRTIRRRVAQGPSKYRVCDALPPPSQSRHFMAELHQNVWQIKWPPEVFRAQISPRIFSAPAPHPRYVFACKNWRFFAEDFRIAQCTVAGAFRALFGRKRWARDRVGGAARIATFWVGRNNSSEGEFCAEQVSRKETRGPVLWKRDTFWAGFLKRIYQDNSNFEAVFFPPSRLGSEPAAGSRTGYPSCSPTFFEFFTFSWSVL